VGNQLLTTTAGTLGVQSVGANVPVVINLSGSEYACDSQNSFFDDPPGNQTTVKRHVGVACKCDPTAIERGLLDRNKNRAQPNL
jgi:hypothetical protein